MAAENVTLTADSADLTLSLGQANDDLESMVINFRNYAASSETCIVFLGAENETLSDSLAEIANNESSLETIEDLTRKALQLDVVIHDYAVLRGEYTCLEANLANTEECRRVADECLARALALQE